MGQLPSVLLEIIDYYLHYKFNAIYFGPVSSYGANHFNLGESGNESINTHKRGANFKKICSN